MPGQADVVAQWLKFMKASGVHAVLCLLTDGELSLYAEPLADAYTEAFGAENVHFITVLHPDSRRRLLQVLADAEAKRQRIVVHCSTVGADANFKKELCRTSLPLSSCRRCRSSCGRNCGNLPAVLVSSRATALSSFVRRRRRIVSSHLCSTSFETQPLPGTVFPFTHLALPGSRTNGCRACAVVASPLPAHARGGNARGRRARCR